MDYKYEDITQVFETTSYKEAQRYLDAGWKLFARADASTKDPLISDAYVLYSLVWYGDNPKFPPEQKYTRCDFLSE